MTHASGMQSRYVWGRLTRFHAAICSSFQIPGTWSDPPARGAMKVPSVMSRVPVRSPRQRTRAWNGRDAGLTGGAAALLVVCAHDVAWNVVNVSAIARERGQHNTVLQGHRAYLDGLKELGDGRSRRHYGNLCADGHSSAFLRIYREMSSR